MDRTRGPSTDINVGSLHAMMNRQVTDPGPLRRDARNIPKNSHPYLATATPQDTVPTLRTSLL